MPHVEVTVPVPEERLADFYSLFGAWLAGEERHVVGGRSRQARSETVSRRSRYAPLYTYLLEQVPEEESRVGLECELMKGGIKPKRPRAADLPLALWSTPPAVTPTTRQC